MRPSSTPFALSVATLMLWLGGQSVAVAAGTEKQAPHASAPAAKAKPAPDAAEGRAGHTPAATTPTKPAVGGTTGHAPTAAKEPAPDHEGAEESAATKTAKKGETKPRRLSIKEAEATAREVVRRVEAVMAQEAGPKPAAARGAAAPAAHGPAPATHGQAGASHAPAAVLHTPTVATAPARSAHAPGATPPAPVSKPAPLLKWDPMLAPGNVRLSWDAAGPSARATNWAGVRLAWAPEGAPTKKP